MPSYYFKLSQVLHSRYCLL